MPVRRKLRAFDLKHLAEGFEALIGVDEVGRGALAGPVVAAAMRVGREFLEGGWVRRHARRIDDSKLLPAVEREALWIDFEALRGQGAIQFHLGVATVEEIEQLNVFGATKLAMRRALEGIGPASAFEAGLGAGDLFAGPEAEVSRAAARVLVDGIALKNFPYPHTAVVKGDAKSLCIAMASIVAKVTRDRMMAAMENDFPGYGFGRHKGYATPVHREAVLRLGRCAQHRELFLRKLLAGQVDPGQMEIAVEEAEFRSEKENENA